MNKNNLTVVIVIIAVIMMFMTGMPTAMHAQEFNQGVPPASGKTDVGNQPSQSTFTLQNPLKVNSIGGLVQTFVEIFSYIVILLAVLMLIWVGFQYILAAARGDSGKIKELHSYLLWIVIGVAVVIGARLMIQVVINTLQATGTVSPGVIQNANQALQPGK